jgi:hypothetical protein
LDSNHECCHVRGDRVGSALNEVVERENMRDDDDGAAGVLVPTP